MSIDVELERRKSAKLAEAAAQAGEAASRFGQDPRSVLTFLTHYFRHVDAADIDERSIEDLVSVVEDHFSVARRRPAARAVISVRTPTPSGGGWTAGGSTAVDIVTDDHPFLVDSVTMEVLRQGWTIRELYHPQFLVRRDVEGALRAVVSHSESANDPTVLGESWMHLEIFPPSRPDRPDRMVPELEAGLRHVLQLVEEAVQDWSRMLTRAEETIAALDGGGAFDAEEAASAAELLRWLVNNHFTFLGYREYHLHDSPQGLSYQPVPGTGLGILRADADVPDTFHALPESDRPAVMVVTKDNHRSRVHRPAYLDYVGIRLFDADGRVIGERRFLGLFSSSAYAEPVARVPVVRRKAAEVLRRSGYDQASHGGKAIMDVLDSYPRDELFQTPVEELSAIVEKVAHLKERRQVRLFVRRDPYGRFISCLVYLPRDRYTTIVRTRIQEVLLAHLHGESIDFTARVTESVLARLIFVVRASPGRLVDEVDVRAVERELTAATRSWNDEFTELVSMRRPAARQGAATSDSTSRVSPDQLAVWAAALPEGYKEDVSPAHAVADLEALLSAQQGSALPMAMFVPDPDDEADLRLKVFRRGSTLALSEVMPHLSRLGVDVLDERPYELELPGETAHIYDFGLRVPGGAATVASWDEDARTSFMAAFAAAYSGESESDAFNALVMAAGLSWQRVAVLRAIGRYLRQVGTAYSQTYLSQALVANVDLARGLVDLFEARFDPAAAKGTRARSRLVAEAVERLERGLDEVASLDHDRIVRSYLAVLQATVRTNAFQPGAPALALKLLPRKIADLPEPRPAFEIFVYSPRVEGVHLRFGAVARGGLRWSDRAEDFRTEILGLVKAQMVKNTVIVPVGAKGGFYAKRLPDPGADREAWLAEGIGCYQTFITSLLSVTDNLVAGEVVPPSDVIRHDDDDPYLVVAADKGTATFSDIANAISVERGFWLGDAFASGGSAGYDHKAMGITARGAWESVRRHFRELGIDCQTTDVSCVGIGDMSGDVFGNGMLLSRHIKLVAAFDHRHVFIDPDPDPERSWQERRRLFDLPRSSWADYDASLLSAGGGVFPRSLKSIPITPQMREVLGIGASVAALSPAQLISTCLKAPVDLLWNGGIGTYVKADAESNAQVGDKANDGLRVNGADVRARCVGEGGNLGFTQLGRIEYARSGGRINTDFIDNSAGVDTSDHEVNIKILLSGETAAGRLSSQDRDALLASMTDEVADLVLAHNIDQNLALANAVRQSAPLAHAHEDWMERLEEQGLLDRDIEYLPSADELDRRRPHRQGLSSPELATLLSYTKIFLEDAVLATDLPDDPYLDRLLISYFPTPLRERFADQMRQHRLRREIVTMVAVNRFVNTAGISCFHRLSIETGAGPDDIVRAQFAARIVFGADALDARIAALDHQIDAAVQTTLRLEVRTLIERATRWLATNRQRPLEIGSAVEALAEGVGTVRVHLPKLLTGRDREAFLERLTDYTGAGVPQDLAEAIAVLPPAYAALPVVHTAARMGRDIIAVTAVHFALGHRLGLDRLLTRIIELPRDDRWQTMARAALRDDLHAVHAQLTATVMAQAHSDAGSGPRSEDAGPSAEAMVERWVESVPAVPESVRTLRTLTAGSTGLARMSVGLRVVRALLPRQD